jgi:hypothetical protein
MTNNFINHQSKNESLCSTKINRAKAAASSTLVQFTEPVPAFLVSSKKSKACP